MYQQGMLLASVDASTTRHFDLDHLGTPRLITGSGGTTLAIHDYFDRTVGVAAFEGELAFGISHLAPAERRLRFPTAAEFRTVWDSDTRVFAVVERRSWTQEFVRDGITHARLLWQGESLALLSNERSSL